MSDKSVIHTSVLIVGSGPAGYTAAIYAARANLKPVLIQGLQPGGQLTITTDVENYPGFAEPIMGPWLMEQMQNQAGNVGTTLVMDMVSSVDFSQKPYLAICDSGQKYSCDAMIIATGAQARWLGLESEERFKGFGVSACATCDGFFYRGKSVAVVGGGNSAVEEALYLTNHAEKVTLIHRRDHLRAEKIMQERLFKNPKIEVIWNREVMEILGSKQPLSVTGVKLKNCLNDNQEFLELDGIFVAIGHSPATDTFRGKVAMDQAGYILTNPDSTATDIPGVYAAGDVRDSIYRQAVTAAGMGCMAALEVERYLAAR